MAEGDGYGEASAFGSLAGDSTITVLLLLIIIFLLILIVLKEVFDRFISGKRKDAVTDRHLYGAVDTTDGKEAKEEVNFIPSCVFIRML